MQFVPLHVHWESSVLDGILRFKDLSKIKEKGFKTIACTDHGSLAGTYEFYKEAVKANLKPIIGLEAYWALDRKHMGGDDLEKARPNYHMILLAKNKNGYKNLMKLSSYSYTEGFYFSPRIDNQLLEQYSSDLIITSACLGSRVNQLILRNELNQAENLIRYYSDLFKDNYFLELQCHEMEEQQIVNKQLLVYAKQLNLPIVVTSDSHYLESCDKQLHDKFLAISTNAKLDDPKRFTFEGLDCHLPTYQEILTECNKMGVPEEAIRNTNYIADQIVPDYFSNIVNSYPKFRDLPEGYTSYEYLELLCKTRYLEMNNFVMPPKEIEDRIDLELKALKKLDFSDYMLILWDIINHGARANNIMTGSARGSCAGSYVAFLLGISQVDPIKYGLIFERFVNPGRGATPKIFND